MDDSWTAAEQVKAGLKKAGFKDVHSITEKGLWQWESYDRLIKYFLEGGNPGNERMLDAGDLLVGMLRKSNLSISRLLRRTMARGMGSLVAMYRLTW